MSVEVDKGFRFYLLSSYAPLLPFSDSCGVFVDLKSIYRMGAV
jgi:hypothetical protein